MKLLYLSILLITSTTTQSETAVQKFTGKWTALKMYIEKTDEVDLSQQTCFTVQLKAADPRCYCGGVLMPSFYVNMSFPNKLNSVVRRKNVFIVDTYSEAYDVAHSECHCGRQDFNVFRLLDDQFYVSYFKARDEEVLDAVLLGRKVPTQLELETYEEQNLFEFRNKRGITLCTRRTPYLKN